ncbi:MAG: LytTR family DNA-binding domain-containing protein [Prevotellaceae bacterium]|jgi:DNA-binding LytR/AlgR family response regulator|nr:LytTR family DNA-binding domain-containing protein [Prevotellaceae bacterium]
MKVLIVEDETVACDNLINMLTDINPSIEIAGNTESISQTVRWLQTCAAPDLILMDIRLSDGSAFAIFDHIQVETPIIFTTAYDEYAIEAFKVNSIDYLLKPIKAEELKASLVKFGKWQRADVLQYLSQLSRLTPASVYKRRILIPVKDQLLPVCLKDVACFYTTNKETSVYLKDGSRYSYSATLEQIASSLNPSDFIRANKQFILARDSVKKITVWFDSRLLVSLDVETPERIYISKNTASRFKAWLTS